MYTARQLLSQLKKMDIPRDGTLLVHSSFKAMGEVRGGAQTVVDVLCDYMSEGLLVMPTHSWATVNADNPVFDPASTPSCTGILGTLLMKKPGALRTIHPTHSLAVYGREAADFAEGEHLMTTPCGRSGCMGKLLDRKAKVLFIGCGLSKNTFLHGVEEWCGIENRLGEQYACMLTMGDGTMFIGAMQPHRAPVPDVSVNYSKMTGPFLQLGAAKEGQLGDAHCFVCDCARMARITTELLIVCPDLFLDDAPVEPALLKDVARGFYTP